MPDILRYHGNLVDTIDPDHIYGPDRDKRYLVVKSVLYDAATDITELRLRGLVGDELTDRIAPLVLQQRRRQQLRGLFSG